MATQYANGKIVTNGLVLCLNAADTNSYPGSGTTWTDVSVNGNNGALINGPAFNSSNGGSIVFDAVDDYVSVNSFTSILSSTSYTKIAWFYCSNFSYGNNIISGADNSQHAFWLAGGNKLNSGHNGSWSTVVSTTTLSLNTWYYGAVTFDTTNGWKLYLNGKQEATSASTTTYTGTGGTHIGAYNAASNLFSGRISTALIYNKVLSPTEILQVYNAQKSRFNL